MGRDAAVSPARGLGATPAMGKGVGKRGKSPCRYARKPMRGATRVNCCFFNTRDNAAMLPQQNQFPEHKAQLLCFLLGSITS